MKKSILVGSLVALVFSSILYNYAVGQQFPTSESRDDGPSLPRPPKPGEVFRHMRDMMQRLNPDTTMTSRCKTLIHTQLFLDSPAVIQAQAADLSLTPDQIKKLADIENEARQKATSLLNEEQLKKLGNIPEKPVAVSDYCLAGMIPAAEQFLQRIIPGQSSPQQPESRLDDSK